MIQEYSIPFPPGAKRSWLFGTLKEILLGVARLQSVLVDVNSGITYQVAQASDALPVSLEFAEQNPFQVVRQRDVAEGPFIHMNQGSPTSMETWLEAMDAVAPSLYVGGVIVSPNCLLLSEEWFAVGAAKAASTHQFYGVPFFTSLDMPDDSVVFMGCSAQDGGIVDTLVRSWRSYIRRPFEPSLAGLPAEPSTGE